METDLAVDGLAEDLGIETNLRTKILEGLKEDLMKCMMLFVIIVEKNVKFHLNQQVINLFFAVIVLEKLKIREVILVQKTKTDQVKWEYRKNNSMKLMQNLIR